MILEITFLLQSFANGYKIVNRKGVKIIHKTVEEIRQESGKSQLDFAKEIGVSPRTYAYRITGEQPNWTLSEIIQVSKFNEGQVTIDHEGKTFNVTIKEVGK